MSASPAERSELLKLIHNAFGPAPTQPRSLEERLASLTEVELKQVMQWANFVKMSQKFGKTNQVKSYAQLTHEMYGKFDNQRKNLIADLLQEADPVEAVGYTPPKTKVSYRDEVGEEWLRATAQPAPSPAAEQSKGNDNFLERLTQSESSGDSKAEITIKDGRKFAGKLQFGEARLQDYKAAAGKTFTQDQFKADEALQDEVGAWHISDLDKTIDALGDKAATYSRDGLRAVAHLGGKGGMKKFVQSGGKHNPSDELGTSLQSYYDKFSGEDT
ncbi:hypothetical protein N9632_00720 [bacterium]|nr:hypothetical protein [bacterium]